jgi:hypothetical protein
MHTQDYGLDGKCTRSRIEPWVLREVCPGCEGNCRAFEPKTHPVLDSHLRHWFWERWFVVFRSIPITLNSISVWASSRHGSGSKCVRCMLPEFIYVFETRAYDEQGNFHSATIVANLECNPKQLRTDSGCHLCIVLGLDGHTTLAIFAAISGKRLVCLPRQRTQSVYI